MAAICCSECFEHIARKDSAAARLWLDLCDYFVKFSGNFKLREHNVPATIQHFKSLESLRFLDTLDGPESVVIRMNGHEVLESGEQGINLDTFCIDRHQHVGTWI